MVATRPEWEAGRIVPRGSRDEPLLQSYVGSSSKAEDYAVAALTPMQSAWDQGDHEFTCFAQNADDSPLNNSIKNS